MNPLYQELKTRCLSLLVDHSTLPEFEVWIYQTTPLEEILDSASYLFLLELDYSSPLAIEQLTRWADHFFVPSLSRSSEFETLKLKKQLEIILTQEPSFPCLMENVVDIQSFRGYRFLDKVLDLSNYFIFLNDMLVPEKTKEWDRLRVTSEGDRQLSETYFPGFRESLEQVIRWLETGQIIVLKVNDSPDDPIFRMEDHRIEEETVPPL